MKLDKVQVEQLTQIFEKDKKEPLHTDDMSLVVILYTYARKGKRVNQIVLRRVMRHMIDPIFINDVNMLIHAYNCAKIWFNDSKNSELWK